MQQVFNGLKATVGGAHQEMKNELDETQQKIGNIENVIKGLNTIKYLSYYSSWCCFFFLFLFGILFSGVGVFQRFFLDF